MFKVPINFHFLFLKNILIFEEYSLFSIPRDKTKQMFFPTKFTQASIKGNDFKLNCCPKKHFTFEYIIYFHYSIMNCNNITCTHIFLILMTSVFESFKLFLTLSLYIFTTFYLQRASGTILSNKDRINRIKTSSIESVSSMKNLKFPPIYKINMDIARSHQWNAIMHITHS